MILPSLSLLHTRALFIVKKTPTAARNIFYQPSLLPLVEKIGQLHGF